MRRGWLEPGIEKVRVVTDRLRSIALSLRGARCGRKVRIGPWCRFEQPARLTLGERVWLEAGVGIKLVGTQSAAEIGAGVFLGRDTQLDILDHLEVGAHCLFGPRCLIVDHNHGMDPNLRIAEQPCIPYRIRIGSGVWCGGGAVLLPGVTIGDGAVIGANAVVTRDVPAMAVVAGNPARILRLRNQPSP